ncbi:transposase [Haemophilus influenzae PittEE]|nr:transposase [Haemophilus influenzae PittEE]
MIGYQNILRENDIQQNMSRKGNCLDNSAMEIFWMVKNGMLLW